MSWLDDVLRAHAEVESPRNFWLWSALVSISAIVKDNVWLDRGGMYNLYPNIYVIFHAESGLKKGPPISFAKNLVKKVNNTNVISGRSSIQGIMKKLGTAQTKPGGRVETKSTGFICSSELSSSIVEDNAALTILTDLYDRIYNVDDWESLLKMETFKLVSPTVSLLGGINDAHADEFFGKKDIQGGFLARTFVIAEKEAQNINSLSTRLTNPPNIDDLSKYLKTISQLKGKFTDFWDESNNRTSVGDYYNDWYQDFTNARRDSNIKDDTGTLNRFGDSLLKIAMLLSLAREPSLEITREDLDEAIIIGEKLIGNIRRTTMGKKGMSASAPLKKLIIYEFLERTPPEITRQILMKKMYLHYTSPGEFDEIMSSLIDAGLLSIRNAGSQIIYVMTPRYYDEITRHLAGKEQ